MNHKNKALTALTMVIPFAVVMVVDPREAIDHPHTHQEAPTGPMLDSGTTILSTLSGTSASLPHGADAVVNVNGNNSHGVDASIDYR